MRKVILGLVLLLLAGCGQVEDVPEPSVTASRTAVPTGTSADVATGTIMTVPKATVMKSTPKPTRQPTTTPIPLAFATPEGNFLEYSPDLQWGLWEVYEGVCGNRFVIQNLYVENFQWEVSDQFTRNNGDTDNYAHWPSHWSVDGRFLYFTTNFGCADGGLSFRGVTSLQRLTLASGDIIDMLPRNRINTAISSDSRQMAFLSGRRVTIRDLLTGAERSVTVEIPHKVSAGDIKWSPDNTKFVYIAEIEKDNYTRFMFTMVFVDTEKMEFKILVEEFQEPPWAYTVKWKNNEEIRLFIARENNNSQVLMINVETGELTLIEE